MMHEREKSDPAVVAVKLANKAERSAAESVEPRAGTEGNAGQHSTCRAQYRVSVSPALERIRHVRRQTPEVGAVCGKAARTVLCGGRSAMSVPTAIVAATNQLVSWVQGWSSFRYHRCIETWRRKLSPHYRDWRHGERGEPADGSGGRSRSRTCRQRRIAPCRRSQ